MALIKCTDCGHDVSDRAAACPHCGFPVSDLRTDGEVRIKLIIKGKSKSTDRTESNYYFLKCKITSPITNEVLWEGSCLNIATFKVNGPTEVLLQYTSKFVNELRYTVHPNKRYQVLVVREVPTKHRKDPALSASERDAMFDYNDFTLDLREVEVIV